MNLGTSFELQKGDIAFQAEVRFDEGNIVVRNTYENGEWMDEERGGPPLPLQKNAHFQCTIKELHGRFEVYIANLLFIAVTH